MHGDAAGDLCFVRIEIMTMMQKIMIMMKTTMAMTMILSFAGGRSGGAVRHARVEVDATTRQARQIHFDEGRGHIGRRLSAEFQGTKS